MDHQIKLRGLRIELGEITMAAESHPLVKDCVVTKVLCDDSEALVAVVLVEAIHILQNSVSASQVLKCIMDKVPDYMVPAQVHIRTEPFPLTPNGKLNLRSITCTAGEEYQRRLGAIADEPKTITRATPNSIEAQIARHWASILNLNEEVVDITTPFSQLGGDSIRAITLLAGLRREGLSLDMSDLRLPATIKILAERVRESSGVNSSTHGRPDYLHSYACANSTIVVLVHPFLGQSKVLETLVPFLNGQFNMILVDDPFFGTSKCPGSLTAWAEIYLKDLILQLPNNHRLILGGYSFGGLIAMEMAVLWEKERGGYPASLLLLDPGTYSPTDLSCATEDEQRQTAEAALSLLGIEQRAKASFEGHYHRHNQVLSQTRTPPVYDGTCLYLTLPDRLGPGSIAEWWQKQCPQLTMHCIDCDNHYALLREPSLAQVGQLVHEQCCLSVGV